MEDFFSPEKGQKKFEPPSAAQYFIFQKKVFFFSGRLRRPYGTQLLNLGRCKILSGQILVPPNWEKGSRLPWVPMRESNPDLQVLSQSTSVNIRQQQWRPCAMVLKKPVYNAIHKSGLSEFPQDSNVPVSPGGFVCK